MTPALDLTLTRPTRWMWWFQPKRAQEINDARLARIRAEVERERTAEAIHHTKIAIEKIEYQLRPEHRQYLTEALARHKANLDALEDDGVAAIQKGDE